MEGDRRIVVHQPGTPVPDSYGQLIPGTPVDHVVWAVRRDRSGREGLVADTQVGEYDATFQVRMDGLKGLDKTWTLTDERGRVHDIEDVAEVSVARNRWWLISAVGQGRRE